MTLWTPANLPAASAALFWLDAQKADSILQKSGGNEIVSWTDRVEGRVINATSQDLYYDNPCQGSDYPGVYTFGASGYTIPATVFPTGSDPVWIACVSRGSGNGNYRLIAGVGDTSGGALLAVDNGNRIYISTKDGSDGNTGFSINGGYHSVIAQFMAASQDVDLDGGSPIAFNLPGTRNTNSGRFAGFANWDSWHQEVLIGRGILSADDRARLQGYLLWKWGQQAQLPQSHAYKSSAPTVDQGAPTVTGAGSSTLAALGGAAVGALALIAAATTPLANLTPTSRASIPVLAKSDQQFAPIAASGGASIVAIGNGTALLSTIDAASNSSASVAATSDVSFDDVSAASLGAVTASAGASAFLGPVASSSAAEVDATAQVAGSLAPVTGTAVAGSSALSIAVGAGTFDDISTDATGGMAISAVSRSSLDAVAVSTAGEAPIRGRVMVALDVVRSTTAGGVALSAQATPTFGGLAGSSAGRTLLSGLQFTALADVVSVSRATNDLPPLRPSYLVRAVAIARQVRASAIRRILTVRKGSNMLLWPQMRVGAILFLGIDWSAQLDEGDTIVEAGYELRDDFAVVKDSSLQGNVYTIELEARREAVRTVLMTASTANGEELREAIGITVLR